MRHDKNLLFFPVNTGHDRNLLLFLVNTGHDRNPCRMFNLRLAHGEVQQGRHGTYDHKLTYSWVCLLTTLPVDLTRRLGVTDVEVVVHLMLPCAGS